MKKKKSNKGRKPIEDKKIGVTIYIQGSVIEKNGGIESVKNQILSLIQ